MDVIKGRLCVYGQNNTRLGTMDSEGVVRRIKR